MLIASRVLNVPEMSDNYQKHSRLVQHCCVLIATSRLLCQTGPSSCQNPIASMTVIMLMVQAAKADKSPHKQRETSGCPAAGHDIASLPAKPWLHEHQRLM